MILELLIVTVAYLAGTTVVYLTGRQSTATLAELLLEERARSRELLSIIEAQKAPQEYFAVTAPEAPEPTSRWVSDDTGLVTFQVPIDEELL